MDENEIEELKKEKEVEKDKDENDLSKKQAEKIKVNGIQKADLNKKVDGKETLGKRLDLEESMAKLRKVIVEMTDTMKKQFTAQFKIINKNFNVIFLKCIKKP